MATSPFHRLLSVSVTCLALLSPLGLRAELLVSESFDLASAQDDPIGTAGATSKGFAPDSKWEAAGAGAHSVTYSSEGLSFPGLATKGGSVIVTLNGPADTPGLNFFREVAANVPEGSTIYGSFLFRSSQINGPYLSFFGIEAGSGAPVGGGSPRVDHQLGDNDLPMLVTFAPDSFSRQEASSQGVKVRRSSGENSLGMSADTAELLEQTTYLVVWQIVNTWGGGVNPATQRTTMWVLSEEDFAKVRGAQGGLTEESLESFHTARVVVENGNWGRLLAGDFIHVGGAFAGEKGRFSSEFDEIRIGDTLESVTPSVQ